MNNSNVIVIGIGRLGATIAQELSSRAENVLCVDINPRALNKLDDFSGFTEVGDATDLSFLEKIDLKSAKAVIITTNDDNTNIYLAHLCFLIFNISKIYIRLGDVDKAKLLSDTPIKAIYPFLLSLDMFNKTYSEA